MRSYGNCGVFWMCSVLVVLCVSPLMAQDTGSECEVCEGDVLAAWAEPGDYDGSVKTEALTASSIGWTYFVFPAGAGSSRIISYSNSEPVSLTIGTQDCCILDDVVQISVDGRLVGVHRSIDGIRTDYQYVPYLEPGSHTIKLLITKSTVAGPSGWYYMVSEGPPELQYEIDLKKVKYSAPWRGSGRRNRTMNYPIPGDRLVFRVEYEKLPDASAPVEVTDVLFQVTGPGLAWSFYGDSTNQWKGEWVVPSWASGGVYTVYCTLYWQATDGSGESGSDSSFAGQFFPGPGHNQFRLYILEVTLKSIQFTSDHGLLVDNTANWQDSGSLYGEPEWTTSHSYPISQTKGTGVQATLTMDVSPSYYPGFSCTIKGTGPAAYLNFTGTGTMSGGTNRTASVIPDAALPGYITTRDSQAVSWSLQVSGNSSDISLAPDSAHSMYVTVDTPFGSVCTEKRLTWACQKAAGASTGAAAADSVHDALGGVDPPYEPGERPSLGWGWPRSWPGPPMGSATSRPS